MRITVRLDTDLALAVRQLATTQGRTQSRVIRDALETYTRLHVRRGFGKYSSGDTDVSERAEEIVMEAARRGTKLRE